MRIALVLVMLFGCDLEANDRTPLGGSVRAAQQRMHERFGAIQRAQDAIVRSNLDLARSEARKIANLDEPEILAKWRPYLDEVRMAANELALAEDLPSAAARLAHLGRRCASCHQAAGARIAFVGEPKPDEAARLAQTMAGHRWAAARMFEGLIGPSDAQWTAGAQMMTRAPLTIVAEGPDGPLGIADDVARVRLLARRALQPLAQDARAEIYGDILATCAHCHAVIRDR